MSRGNGTRQQDSPFASPALPKFKRWCVICERVGKKRWPWMALGDSLISPHGTAHFQSERVEEHTVCGLDATRDGWRWPE